MSITTVGSSVGIRLQLNRGLLAAFTAEMHRKPWVRVQETIAGAEPVPDDALRITFPMGERRLAVVDAPVPEPLFYDPANDQTLRAELKLTFSTTHPVSWTLVFDEGALAPPLSFDVSVEGAQRKQSDGVIRFVRPIPAGETTVVVTITSRPLQPFADTAIVCRPWQLQEAAVALSFFDKPVAFVVIPSPPCPRVEHVQRYREFHRLQDVTMARLGTRMSREDIADPEQVMDILPAVVQRRILFREMTAFRSWRRIVLTTRAITTALALRRAIWLFAPVNEELGVEPNATEEEERVDLRLFREDVEPLIVTAGDTTSDIYAVPHHRYQHIGDLTDVLARLLDTSSDGAILVRQGDMSGTLTGLARAWHDAKPLRISTGEGPQTTAAAIAIEDAFAEGTECVLVESADDATLLASIIYARERRARIVIRPPADVKAIDAALDAQQSRIRDQFKTVEAKPSAIDAGDKGLFEHVRSFFAIGSSNGVSSLDILRDAVAAAVPDEVVRAVGNASLTAFTRGVPYNLFRRGADDWARKTIGHVSADGALLILRELFAASAPRSTVSFSVLVDPGFFDTDETKNVLNELREHFTRPIVLSKEVASLQGMQQIAGTLPLEFLFFNTHGDDESILLSSGPLERHELVQWLRFQSWPIVFNNSCLSWTGVGEEFVRIGARGYIGTLWSVLASVAAEFARAVLHRMVSSGTTVAAAMRDTGLSPDDELPYIFVGTASARLDLWPEAELHRDVRHILATYSVLTAVFQAAVDERIALDEHLLQRLSDDVREVRNVLIATAPLDSAETLDALLGELGIWAGSLKPLPRRDGAIGQLAGACRDRIETAAPLADLERSSRRARLYFWGGKLLRLDGNMEDALDAELRSLEELEPTGQSPANQYREIADILLLQGHYERAVTYAEQAKQQYERDGSDLRVLGATGLLALLHRRLHGPEEAMRHVCDGLALAERLGERRQAAEFHLDKSRLHRMLGEPDQAVDEAQVALEMYRQLFDDLGELRGRGYLGQAYAAQGRLEEAREQFEKGLHYAQVFGIDSEVAGFTVDLASLHFEQGEVAKAIPLLETAILRMVKVGSSEQLRAMIPLCLSWYEQLGDVGRNFHLAEQLAGAALLTGHLRALLYWIVHILKRSIDSVESEVVIVRLDNLRQIAATAMERSSEDDVPGWSLLGEIIDLLDAARNSRHASYLETARNLDERTGGWLELERFLEARQ